MRRELDRFAASHPRSRELRDAADGPLLSGVPMNWMTRWPGAYPVVFEHAEGNTLTDVDGNAYVDFCLGDTGAMSGHSPPPTVAAAERPAAARDHDDAAERGRRPGRRGDEPPLRPAPLAVQRSRRPTPTASSLRICREITRPAEDPRLQPLLPRLASTRPSRRSVDGGPVAAGSATSGRRCRSPRRRGWSSSTTSPRWSASSPTATSPACSTEPALTNIGIVLPDPGFHAGAARADPRRRDAAGDRRDPHALLRARRLHGRARARAGPDDDRQGDRRRHPDRRLRDDRRGRRADPRARRSGRRPTSAASAAPWPATRSRWRRPGRPSPRC